MKQTAVEWYAEQGMKLEISRLKGRISTEKMLDLLFEKLRQAKEMEKEQIIDAWINSLTKGDYNSAEEYYNKTFKSE